MIDQRQNREENGIFGILGDVRERQPEAEQEFFDYFAPRLERVCSRILGSLPAQPGAIVSPESKAISAIWSFMKGLNAGRFGTLEDETGLLRLLVCIATRKCRDAQRAHLAASRGGGKIVRPNDYADDDSRQNALEQIGQYMESPLFEFEMKERCERLMAMLSPKDQVIAQKRLEGYTEDEIAGIVGMSRRSVQLHIAKIRQQWSGMIDD